MRRAPKGIGLCTIPGRGAFDAPEAGVEGSGALDPGSEDPDDEAADAGAEAVDADPGGEVADPEAGDTAR